MQLMVDKHFVEVIESDIKQGNNFQPRQEVVLEKKDQETNPIETARKTLDRKRIT